MIRPTNCSTGPYGVLNIHLHPSAITVVGKAHGNRLIALTIPRPFHCLFRSRAIKIAKAIGIKYPKTEL